LLVVLTVISRSNRLKIVVGGRVLFSLQVQHDALAGRITETSPIIVPEVPVPELPIPEVPVPELPIPEVPAPELPIPEVPALELPIPEVPAPEVPAPVVPISEVPVPVRLPEEQPAVQPQEPAMQHVPVEEEITSPEMLIFSM
jgi:hypothetical protein